MPIVTPDETMQPMISMVTRIGFFHFGINHSDPLGSLQSALSAAGHDDDVSQSLVVLPQGMNIRKWYRDPGKCDTSPEIIRGLQVIAKQFQTTFVAGLILTDHNVGEPYSSAYLINDAHCILLCHKTIDDRVRNYAGCTGNPDIHNPILYDGVDIATIICADVQNKQRCGTLLARPAAHAGKRQVVCIPACMGWDFFSAGRCGQRVSIADSITIPTVLANADPSGCSSFITDAGGLITHCHTGKENKVMLAPL